MNSTAAQTDDAAPPVFDVSQQGRNNWLGKLGDWLSDFFSPIMVKECRQALKSKSFVWTYFLMLIVVGGWINASIAFRMLDQDFNGLGRELLKALLIIGGFPLCLVIPFSAARSLAKEYETGSIQLISITTMRPWGIVIGKLTSSLLQMLIYLSVLAPCMLMTYLLRGVSLVEIVFFLTLGVVLSIGLTVLGIFLGGVVKLQSVVGTLISLGLMLLLGWLYFIWCWAVTETIDYDNTPNLMEPQGQIVLLALIAFVGSFVVLLLTCACSQVSFASDNKSTPVRMAMFLQQTVFLGFVFCVFMESPGGPPPVEFFTVMTVFIGHYWLLMGGFMIGESRVLSRRVRRSLPNRGIAQSLLGLFMPGSGRGYLFAVSMMLICSFLLVLTYHLFESLQSWLNLGLVGAMGRTAGWGGGLFGFSQSIEVMLVFLCFPIGFLSISYLLVGKILQSSQVRQTDGLGPVLGLGVTVLVAGLWMLVTALLHFSLLASNQFLLSITPFSVLNWYLMAGIFMDNKMPDASELFLLAIVFLPFILWAILVAVKELRVEPIPIPQRVLQDQQELKQALPAGESLDEIFGKID